MQSVVFTHQLFVHTFFGCICTRMSIYVYVCDEIVHFEIDWIYGILKFLRQNRTIFAHFNVYT